jgi:hypothetical protein
MYSRGEYSEPGIEIYDGEIAILTHKKTGENLITLERRYNSSNYNLTYEGADKKKEITPGHWHTKYSFQTMDQKIIK